MSLAIKIDPSDNVFVALAPLSASQHVEGVTLREAIEPAHKFAARDIGCGEPVIKYGYPIGVASVDIPAGAHVHTQNVRSALTGDLADLKFEEVAIAQPAM